MGLPIPEEFRQAQLKREHRVSACGRHALGADQSRPLAWRGRQGQDICKLGQLDAHDACVVESWNEGTTGYVCDGSSE